MWKTSFSVLSLYTFILRASFRRIKWRTVYELEHLKRSHFENDHTSGLTELDFRSEKTLAISYVKNWLKFICSYLHSIIRLHGHFPSHYKFLKPYRRKNHSLRTEDAKRGTLLTDFEMGKITGSHEDGKSVTEIADALGRSYNCIGNFLKRKRPYTTWFQNTSKYDAKHHQVIIKLVLLLAS